MRAPASAVQTARRPAERQRPVVPLRTALRADASTQLGMGHVMRCLVLADQLRARGGECWFLCKPAPGDGEAAITASGHGLLRLPQAPCGAAQDAAQCLDALRQAGDAPWDWLVADHYALDAAWETTMARATGARLLAIDGQAARRHDADLLLDPVGLPGQEDRWDGLLPARCKRLIGPAHALLRPEFRGAARHRQQGRPAPGDPPRVLLCFGGSDAPDATRQVLKALAGGRPALAAAFDVVIGAGYPHGPALAELAAGLPAVTVHRQPPQLADLMRRADLAVCAGGGTLLELCALGTPALVVSIAQNQRLPAQAMSQAGCALDMGPLDGLRTERLQQEVAALLGDAQRRQRMACAQATLMATAGPGVAELMGRASAATDHSCAPVTP